jgi:hypothetical protein
VLKVGSALLIGADGDAAQGWLNALAADAAAFRKGGRQVIVVTSGAVALGRRVLNLKGKLNLEEKQAAAAAGQTRLMRAWEIAFAPHGLPVAQALLTPEDTERRRRWLNARATLETLLTAALPLDRSPVIVPGPPVPRCRIANPPLTRMFRAVSLAAVAAIVIVPAPSVIVIPLPSVNVANV